MARPSGMGTSDAKARALRCRRRLRSRSPADRRHRANRRPCARVHDARAGRDLLPRVPARGVRHCRAVAFEFHGANRARGQPLCRRARVPLTLLPARRHLHPHRPRHPHASRSQGPQGRPRRIPAHRQCVDTRLPRRRFPSRAGVDPLGAGRHRGAGSPREDPDHAAAGRRDDGGAGRALAVGAPACRRDRRPDRPAHAFGR